MRILVLASDSPVGSAVTRFHALTSRHELIPLSRSACRWKSERQAKKAVVRGKCQAVLDLRLEAVAIGGGQIQDRDVQRCHWIAKACQRTNTAHVLLSSSRVFSGELDRLYTEEDAPDNDETVGQMLAAAEARVAAACERHLILRMGPIFSSEGVDIGAQLLDPLQQGDSLILDDNLRGSPVAVEDAARVILAVLDQVSAGAEAWGIFHYGSGDTATLYEFAEALLAAASQYAEFGSSALQIEREPEGLTPQSRALDCTKLRDTFAIRQVSWRRFVGGLVSQYYAQQEETSDGQSN